MRNTDRVKRETQRADCECWIGAVALSDSSATVSRTNEEVAPPHPSEARDHLVMIARCPIVERCLTGEARHPCAPVVLSQWRDVDPAIRHEHWRSLHQIPEPWEGHIGVAPILFVSSNPSINGSIREPVQLPPPPDDGRSWLSLTPAEHPSIRHADGPKWSWRDDELVDFYESSFDLYIADGIRARRRDGGVHGVTVFWAAVKRRAQELIPQRPVRPGIDYALTEVVRCKSRGEHGVASAAATCSSRYLLTTLEFSAARVVVALGRWAQKALHELVLPGTPAMVVHGPLDVAGRSRLVAFLPHPNARAARSFESVCTQEELERLRSHLRTGAT